MAFMIDEWFIAYELGQMERYLELLNTAIGDNQKQFIASVEKIASTMSDDEKAEFYESNEDDFAEVSRDFPQLLFSSFVVSWYSFVESHLVGFCKSRDLKISLSIQDNENYGEGIRRAYYFLDRAAGYKIDNVHWQELTRINKTRNKLVHNNGRLSISLTSETDNVIPVNVSDEVTLYLRIDNDLYRYFEKHKLLEYRGTFYIVPNFEYCKHLVNFGKEFFVKLHKDFGKKA